jgi:hypothetical protein
MWKPSLRHECLTTFILSIPERIVEHRTLVHLIRAFTSIWCDCVGMFCQCVEERISQWFIAGARSRGAPPLH